MLKLWRPCVWGTLCWTSMATLLSDLCFLFCNSNTFSQCVLLFESLNALLRFIMPGCTVPNCSNSSQKGFKLYRFPSDKERNLIWVQNCGRELGWQPTKHTCVCEVSIIEFFINLNIVKDFVQLKGAYESSRMNLDKGILWHNLTNVSIWA